MKTFLLELNVLRFITLYILSGYKYLYLFPSAAVESIINFSATIRLNFSLLKVNTCRQALGRDA